MKEKRPELLMVEWTDSCSPPDAWVYVDALKGGGAMPCVTVGFLVDEGPGYKTLAGSLTQDDGPPRADGCMTIPAHAIQRIRRLTTRTR